MPTGSLIRCYDRLTRIGWYQDCIAGPANCFGYCIQSFTTEGIIQSVAFVFCHLRFRLKKSHIREGENATYFLLHFTTTFSQFLWLVIAFSSSSAVWNFRTRVPIALLAPSNDSTLSPFSTQRSSSTTSAGRSLLISK